MPDDGEDWTEDLEERAAILEYHGGMTREQAEAAAWDIVGRKQRKDKAQDSGC